MAPAFAQGGLCDTARGDRGLQGSPSTPRTWQKASLSAGRGSAVTAHLLPARVIPSRSPIGMGPAWKLGPRSPLRTGINPVPGAPREGGGEMGSAVSPTLASSCPPCHTRPPRGSVASTDVMQVDVRGAPAPPHCQPLSVLQADPHGRDPRRRGPVLGLAPQALPGEGQCSAALGPAGCGSLKPNRGRRAWQPDTVQPAECDPGGDAP